MVESHRKGDEKVSSTNRENSFSSWLLLIRPPFLLATAGSIGVGGALAYYETGSFHWFLFILTLVAGVLIHMGTNSANDYFDHLSGNDDINVQFVRPFTGGSRMIQQGRLEPSAVLKFSISLLAVAAFVGFYLILQIGWIILVLGLFGAFCGFFYAAPPVRLASKGVGEVLVGLNFGVLLVNGAYYVQTLTFKLQPFLVSLPIASSITAVLWINEFPDYEADREVGKETMVVRMGLQKASRVFVGLILLVYALPCIFILAGFISYYVAFILTTLPLGILTIIETQQRYSKPETLAPANASAVLNHLFILGLLIKGHVLPSIDAPSDTLVWMGIIALTISSATAIGCRKKYGPES